MSYEARQDAADWSCPCTGYNNLLSKIDFYLMFSETGKKNKKLK